MSTGRFGSVTVRPEQATARNERGGVEGRSARIRAVAIVATAFVSACGPMVIETTDATVSDASDAQRGSDASTASDSNALPDGRIVRGPYATRVASFEPGEGAGFGQSNMPDIVLGPPVGAGDQRGSTDAVSLGRNGRICIAFDDVTVVDGPGPDFIVFENPFYVAGTGTLWDELGEVSVSEDGVNYVTFPCDPTVHGPPFPGCAGWNPVYSRPGGIAADDVTNAGGDAFDLATVGVSRARFVCVRDLATQMLAPPTTGFDLDAVGAVNFE